MSAIRFANKSHVLRPANARVIQTSRQRDQQGDAEGNDSNARHILHLIEVIMVFLPRRGDRIQSEVVGTTKRDRWEHYPSESDRRILLEVASAYVDALDRGGDWMYGKHRLDDQGCDFYTRDCTRNTSEALTSDDAKLGRLRSKFISYLT